MVTCIYGRLKDEQRFSKQPTLIAKNLFVSVSNNAISHIIQSYNMEPGQRSRYRVRAAGWTAKETPFDT